MSVLKFARKMIRRKVNPVSLLHTLNPSGSPLRKLIHVGAHMGQERHLYESCGYDEVLWIEGSPSVHARLTESLNEHTNGTGVSESGTRHHSVCSILSEKSGEDIKLLEFSNDGESSSMFPPTSETQKRWPHVTTTGRNEVVRSRTLDEVAEECGILQSADVLIVDVQGAELLVLKGADQVLRNVKAVISEVSTVPYYDGGVLFPELNSFLETKGFCSMSVPRKHGDMLFLRRDLAAKCA